MLFVPLQEYGYAEIQLNLSAQKQPESGGNGCNQLESVCIAIGIAISIATSIGRNR